MTMTPANNEAAAETHRAQTKHPWSLPHRDGQIKTRVLFQAAKFVVLCYTATEHCTVTVFLESSLELCVEDLNMLFDSRTPLWEKESQFLQRLHAKIAITEGLSPRKVPST